jgi:thiol-disulfide isomerase/thioredoxin
MEHKRMFPVLVLALVVGPWLGGQAAAGTEVEVGTRVANLTFKDIHFLPRSLDELAAKKAVVLIFTNTSCPLVQRYFPTLNALENDYRDQGVQVLAVNVGADDTILTMAAQAVRFEVGFPFVKDFDARGARALGVERTPTAVLLDGQRRLCYRGRIDDQYRLVGTRAAATRHDLREALDAVLAGREVAVKETPVDGCLITRPAPPRVDRPITFAEHVAPILRKHCQECHRPGTTAPFPLITYKQVASRADMVAEVVAEGRMPPWFASPKHGTFINRRALTADERDTVLAWARAGTPRGDDSRLPKAPPADQRDGQWLIGTPDLIVRAPEHHLPASGDVPYKYVMLPYVFKEETWLQGVQILPDNPRVLHHCNMAHVQLTKKFDDSNFITGTVPGGSPVLLRDGLAMRIPKGSTLILQIHYVTTGREERCRISVGFRYAREVVQKETHHLLLEDIKFAIPPGAPAYPVSASKVLDRDAVGIGLFAHMHLRGRDMTFRAHYPDGKTETLLVIPNYSFDWQIPYVWEPGTKRFPRGTRLESIAHYDNSPFNPFNPDPTATVREGPQTHHEMLNGFVFYTDANERLNLRVDPKTGRALGRAQTP